MKKIGTYFSSSFVFKRCCDETAITPTDPQNPTAWRAKQASVSCILIAGRKNGYATVATLEKYFVLTALLTGDEKPNVPSDPDYIPDYFSPATCSADNHTITGYPTFTDGGGYNTNQFAVGFVVSEPLGYEIEVTANARVSVNGIYQLFTFTVILPIGQTYIETLTGGYSSDASLSDFQTYVLSITPNPNDGNTIVYPIQTNF